MANMLAPISLEILWNFDFRPCCCLWFEIAVDKPSVVRLRSCFVAQLIFLQLLFCGNVSLHSFGQFEHTKFERKTSVKAKYWLYTYFAADFAVSIKTYWTYIAWNNTIHEQIRTYLAGKRRQFLSEVSVFLNVKFAFLTGKASPRRQKLQHFGASRLSTCSFW